MSVAVLGAVRRRVRVAAALCATAVAATVMVAPAADAAGAPPGTSVGTSSGTSLRAVAKSEVWTAGRYVVTLAAAPAASYTGGVRGLAATKPASGRRIDGAAPEVRSYRSHLLAQQDAVLKAVGARATYRYTMAGNGFAAKLTAAQASRLASTPGVLALTKDTPRQLATTETPNLLGLSGRNGLWKQLGGQANAGQGIVVGIIDSGITPGHPMLAGSKVTRTLPDGVGVPYRTRSGAIAMTKARGGVFTGICQTGPQFPATSCNSTLLSARYFSEGYLAEPSQSGFSKDESLSPLDGMGHGTHTATTAVGRPVKDVVIGTRHLGPAAGMAPGAKLAVYKACWAKSGEPLCYTSDSVKAIDQAVADGVDVINYSTGDLSMSVVDPVDLAFLAAASAGVFVAVSAGNRGPAVSTVRHNSPWLMSVAASTAHRFENTVVLGNGTKLRGASLNYTPLAATAVVRAVDARLAGADASDVVFCGSNTLDPAKVAGKVVICDRGTFPRAEKSAEVARAGGVAMILTNPTSGSSDADEHVVPTVHIDAADRTTLLAYLASTPTPTVAFQVGDTTGLPPTTVPQIASFSSRGPSLGTDGDLLKPDITAPGANIVAGVAPAPNEGQKYAIYSGTSMSSPHIAGLAALLMQAHPTWTPMAVKSAMMTTATDLLDSKGAKAGDPFAQGAGLVQPKRFLNPGLVYDSGVNDWLGFLEGQGVTTQSGLAPIDASDVNLASIAIGDLPGEQTVTRTVTAVTPGTYQASVSLPGIKATVTPSTLRFTKAGQKQTFKVTFQRTTAALDAYTKGFLTWTGPRIAVRSPIAVKPVVVSAPAAVQGTGTSGSLTYQARPGTSPIKLAVSGLVAGTSTSGSLVPGPLTEALPDKSNYIQTVTVPAGSALTRFDLVSSDPAANFDVYIADENDDFVGFSVNSFTVNERVDLTDLPAGTYRAVVHRQGTDPQAAKPASFTLRTYIVPAGAKGNLTAPATVAGRIGSPSPITLTWKGLQAGTPYLGLVRYGNTSTLTAVAIG